MTYRLGKLPAVHDPRTLKLSAYIKEIPEVPDWDWGAAVESAGVDWGMMKNDEAGNCAIVSPAHLHMAWTASSRGKPEVIPDADIMAAYSAVSGYVPGRPETDTGCVMLDVMKYWVKKGIGGKKPEGFVSVEAKNPDMHRFAGWLFGGVNLGLMLPAAVKDYFERGKDWVAPLDPRNARGQWAPGSWGGHAVCGIARKGVCVTWGRRQRYTDAFIKCYCDEAFVALDREAWLDAHGKAPNAIAWADLWSDLSKVTDGRVPVPDMPPGPVTPPAPPFPVPTSGLILVTFSVNAATGAVDIVDKKGEKMDDVKRLTEYGCEEHLLIRAKAAGLDLSKIVALLDRYGASFGALARRVIQDYLDGKLSTRLGISLALLGYARDYGATSYAFLMDLVNLLFGSDSPPEADPSVG